MWMERAPRGYEPIGFEQSVALTRDWKSFRFGFTATADESEGQLVFDLGGKAVSVDVKDLHLQPGGKMGLGDDESTDNHTIAVFPRVAHGAALAGYRNFPARHRKKFLGRHARLHQERFELQRPGHRHHRLRANGIGRAGGYGFHRRARLLAASSLSRAGVGYE